MGRRAWTMVVVATLVLTSMGGVIVAIGGSTGDAFLNRFKVVTPVEPLLPKDVKTDMGFEMGPGLPVGTVQKLSGQVYVIHRKEKIAYRLKGDSPLFEGDTIVTSTRSRINAIMQDQSLFSMAPSAMMVIDKSYYNAEKKERSSIMGLLFGQVRFLVKKLGASPNFRVKTPTAVCGVRGSDFAVAVGPEEGPKQSALDRILDRLNPVSEAHAIVPMVLGTTVLTGASTSVTFAGVIGTTQIVGPYAVSFAAVGAGATSAVAVTVSLATATLSAVGPGLATLAMPPGFD